MKLNQQFYAAIGPDGRLCGNGECEILGNTPADVMESLDFAASYQPVEKATIVKVKLVKVATCREWNREGEAKRAGILT